MNETTNETLLQTNENTFEAFTRGLYIYGVPVICMFGILGNMLSFKLFMCTSMRTQPSSTYIAALSLSDTGFLMSLLLSWLGGGRIGIRWGHSPIWCHLMIYVTYVCSFLSVWYVVLITIDRYIVVCHSLRASEWCSKRRSVVATAIITVFGMTLYAHTFFTAKVVGENCSILFKPFMLKIISILIYSDTVISFIVPFALIFFLNIVVIICIRRFQHKHVSVQIRSKQTDTNSSDQKSVNVLSKAQFRITRMFTLVSVVMLVTNVPSHGIRFYIIVNHMIQQSDSMLVYAQHLFQILYYFNFAVNFLLYSASSDKFRRYLSFKHMCYWLYKRRFQRNNGHLYQ